MRMWLVDPRKMCGQHLLGEHVEMHMFVGSIRKGIAMDGYIDGGLVNTAMLYQRHAELVKEMTRRGMRHKSPILGRGETMQAILAKANRLGGGIDIVANEKELRRRCPDCAALMK